MPVVQGIWRGYIHRPYHAQKCSAYTKSSDVVPDVTCGKAEQGKSLCCGICISMLAGVLGCRMLLEQLSWMCYTDIDAS